MRSQQNIFVHMNYVKWQYEHLILFMTLNFPTFLFNLISQVLSSEFGQHLRFVHSTTLSVSQKNFSASSKTSKLHFRISVFGQDRHFGQFHRKGGIPDKRTSLTGKPRCRPHRNILQRRFLSLFAVNRKSVQTRVGGLV